MELFYLLRRFDGNYNKTHVFTIMAATQRERFYDSIMHAQC